MEKLTLPSGVIYIGNCLKVLPQLPEQSIHSVITSPPYFNQRDYETGQWEGGDSKCDHKGPPMRTKANINKNWDGGNDIKNQECREFFKTACKKCGAVRVKDNQLGLEETPDCLALLRGERPCKACYVCKLVRIFRKVRKVLHDDGVVFLNLGDSYSGSGSGGSVGLQATNIGSLSSLDRRAGVPGFKCKDLMGIPWRVALALQTDGWYLRSDIPWVKRNGMPAGNIKDRPGTALEHIFLLAKNERYYFDMEAIKKPGSVLNGIDPNPDRSFRNTDLWFESLQPPHGLVGMGDELVGLDVTVDPWKGAHYATFPRWLVRPLILCSTSQKGCCKECGTPWERIVEKEKVSRVRPNQYVKREGKKGTGNVVNQNTSTMIVKTVGWKPTCECNCKEVTPAVILDPFGGAMTVPLMATAMNRRFVAVELNPEYARDGEFRVRTRGGIRTPSKKVEDGFATRGKV